MREWKDRKYAEPIEEFHGAAINNFHLKSDKKVVDEDGYKINVIDGIQFNELIAEFKNKVIRAYKLDKIIKDGEENRVPLKGTKEVIYQNHIAITNVEELEFAKKLYEKDGDCSSLLSMTNVYLQLTATCSNCIFLDKRSETCRVINSSFAKEILEEVLGEHKKDILKETIS